MSWLLFGTTPPCLPTYSFTSQIPPITYISTNPLRSLIRLASAPLRPRQYTTSSLSTSVPKALPRAGNASNSEPATMARKPCIEQATPHIASQLPNGFQFSHTTAARCASWWILYWMARAWDTRGQFYTAVPSQAAMGLRRYLISRSGGVGF